MADTNKGPEIIVKGGTGTSGSEKLYEERHHDAEQRRDVAAREKALSANQQKLEMPDGDGELLMPGSTDGAVQYSSQFTEHPEIPKAYILIHIANRAGALTGEQCLADLIQGLNPDDPRDLTLIIVCPYCQEHSHKKQQDNQLRIRQSNKNFEFQEGVGPPIIEYPDPDSGLWLRYPSAGVIVESEAFSCHDCGTRYRIERNVLRPD
jgi:uncharacterized protein YbaR (Trm112 family)